MHAGELIKTEPSISISHANEAFQPPCSWAVSKMDGRPQGEGASLSGPIGPGPIASAAYDRAIIFTRLKRIAF